MSHVKVSGNVWWGLDDDEGSFGFDFAICCEFRFKKPFLLPPCIPSGFDSGRIVGFILRIVEGLYD
jgi:hypothetical protein